MEEHPDNNPYSHPSYTNTNLFLGKEILYDKFASSGWSIVWNILWELYRGIHQGRYVWNYGNDAFYYS